MPVCETEGSFGELASSLSAHLGLLDRIVAQLVCVHQRELDSASASAASFRDENTALKAQLEALKGNLEDRWKMQDAQSKPDVQDIVDGSPAVQAESGCQFVTNVHTYLPPKSGTQPSRGAEEHSKLRESADSVGEDVAPASVGTHATPLPSDKTGPALMHLTSAALEREIDLLVEGAASPSSRVSLASDDSSVELMSDKMGMQRSISRFTLDGTCHCIGPCCCPSPSTQNTEELRCHSWLAPLAPWFKLHSKSQDYSGIRESLPTSVDVEETMPQI